MSMRKRDIDEKILSSLKTLYESRGYMRYKMNRFEEYDLYANNRDFLISDSVITFTDGNGKLLALKPDVTLSIVKNTKDADEVERLYYNENVYRTSKGTHNFREIMQIGLECIGDLDRYNVYEVLRLAAESLCTISSSYVLCVSHLGLVTSFFTSVGIPNSRLPEVLSLLEGKNTHGLTALLREMNIDEKYMKTLDRLLFCEGRIKDVLPEFCGILEGFADSQTLAEFREIMSLLSENENIQLDLSVVGNLNYYNGFVFRGYVEGIAASILSGGGYDALMRRMNKKSRALGFAVYTDDLEQYYSKADKLDADVLILYKDSDMLSDVANAVSDIISHGKTAEAMKSVPKGRIYGKCISIDEWRSSRS